MHIPKTFQQLDKNALYALINEYPFATLITQNSVESSTEKNTNNIPEIEVNHIPLLLKQNAEKMELQGHIAKANTLWQTCAQQSDVTIVFNGPNCYISPNYYPTKAINGKAVPTWNYIAVHVKGSISFIHDNEWKLSSINDLTNHHEAHQSVPWSIEDAPTTFITKMLPAIVGINIEISSIIGKWKVSQNQPEVNQQGVITALSHSKDPAIQQIAKWVNLKSNIK